MTPIKALFVLLLFISCSIQTPPTSGSSQNLESANDFIQKAHSYLGTPYKFGGITKKGMDCSGLIYTISKESGISVPRTSFEQSKKGQHVKIKNVTQGDLLFFSTSKSGKVNHVGTVSRIQNGEVFFIHSSSSKGVIESSLNNSYWNPRFLFAKRIL